ncbi:MAG: hypothetical protein IPI49_13485 [Myxococcales bacterium]|mgnify:CR=1 FL=1|nr:hypothetical protein [Myxococcales bacterium]HRC57510.1 hypothetical protein [Kofleriaceae bacterium]
MAQKIDADVDVRRFGFVSGPGGPRLLFPHATAQNLDGRSGSMAYGAKELAFDGLEGRLDGVRWHAEAASLGEAWLRDDSGRLEMAIGRVELTHGFLLVRAERGVEIVVPHASLSDVHLTFHAPLDGRTAAAAAPPSAALRQERLRFLEGVAGKINLTIKVKLDLPVLGPRSLDQTLRVPIVDGSLDFRLLNESLDWLEGAFLDLGVDQDRLAVSFRVPIFGSSRDIISWALDRDAGAMARFGRVPLRSLADFRIGRGGATEGRAADKKRSILRALTLDNIEVALSMLAPRHLEVGGGMILFGGDDTPGIVNLQIAGSIDNRAEGNLRGTAGSVDTTIKDLKLGPLSLTADRLSFDRVEDLQIAFDGFVPKAASFAVHRVTASNLRLTIS